MGVCVCVGGCCRVGAGRNASAQICSVIERWQEIVCLRLTCMLLRVSPRVLHAWLRANGDECLQHAEALFAVLLICSMCNSDDPCHLHVSAVCVCVRVCLCLQNVCYPRRRSFDPDPV